MAMRFLEAAFLVLAMLVLGSYNTIASKLMFETNCPTFPSGHHVFNKPWLSNLLMFIGEASLLIPYQVRKHRKRRGPSPDNSDLTQTLLAPPRGVPAYLFALPAGLDVAGTGLAACALMFINAAVWQMLRGSLIVFSAILSVAFLKRRLQGYHWVGVGIVVVGLVLIGFAAILDMPTTGTGGGRTSLGIALVIFAQVFTAVQVTFEEYLLTGHEVSSMQTVGMEGAWGIGFMVVLLSIMTYIPGDDHGVYESLPDGLHMLRGSRSLQILSITYMVCIALYNFVSMQLCRKLSAVTRCLVDSMRTGVVWGFQLFMYYCVSNEYGQAWTSNSFMQLIGFALLIWGTLIYNGIVKLPQVDYRNLDLPRQVLQASWSPTVNRAAAWGWGPSFGLHSPNPNMSPPASPLPVFGILNSPQTSHRGDSDCEETIVFSTDSFCKPES